MMDDFARFNDRCKALLEVRLPCSLPRRWSRRSDSSFISSQAIENPSIWGIFAIPQLTRVTDDRVVLIGDCGHATTPHCGAGAGQGIEVSCWLAAASRLLLHLRCPLQRVLTQWAEPGRLLPRPLPRAPLDPQRPDLLRSQRRHQPRTSNLRNRPSSARRQSPAVVSQRWAAVRVPRTRGKRSGQDEGDAGGTHGLDLGV